MSTDITYFLNRRNRIELIEGAWSEFANANDGQSIADPQAVIGQSFLKFLAGSEIQSLYEQIFESVRATQKTMELPYRCDSPELRRYMRLKITPLPNKALRVESIELSAEEREPLEVLQADMPVSDDHSINICSVCRRMSVTGRDWVEPEDTLLKDHLFALNERPKLIERVCEDCATLAKGCRYLVTGALDDPEPLPVVLFLHGASQGEGLLRLLAPPRLTAGEQAPGFLVVSPVLRPGERWDMEEIEDILSEVLANYNCDASRIYGTGISAGAIALWGLAGRGTFNLAAIAPVCSFLTVPTDELARDVFQNMPIWSFFGEKDPVVPVHAAKDWFDEMQSINPHIRITFYPEAEHDVWARVYTDPEFWSWLLEQRRRPVTPIVFC